MSGEYGIGYTTKGEEFWFDLEDYELIKEYCWSIKYYGDNYVDVIADDKNGKKVRLSRVIMKCKHNDNKTVDHIHGSKTRHDNRKSNLRVTDDLHNSYNSGLQKNNKSGVTGVCWSKQSEKWFAFITYNRKRIRLGLFKNFDEAVRIRKEAEERYFGEFSYDNSQRM